MAYERNEHTLKWGDPDKPMFLDEEAQPKIQDITRDSYDEELCFSQEHTLQQLLDMYHNKGNE